MGPLSKLWATIENANSEKDGNAPVVQMGTVLELLEKTVVLIGQCSNTITYERRKKTILGVTGKSTTQVAVMLKEKAPFLQKHNKALFGKEFTDNLAETIKAKKLSIEAITEVNRPNNRQPFRGDPSQNKMDGGQRQYYRKGYKQVNGKMLSFARNTFFPQHITSKSSTIKHRGFDSCLSTSKTLIFKNNSTNLPSGRKIKTFSTCLETTNKRSKCLVPSRRIQDPSAARTKANVSPKTATMEQRSERTDRLVSERDVGEGSYLQSFTSGRRISQSNISSRENRWGDRPVINLKNLNKFVLYQHFEMEGLHYLKFLLQNGDCMCKIDLKDAYFSVPLSKDSRKLLRFQWEGSLYEFLCLCFGPGPARRAFTKLLKVQMSVLRRLMIRAIIFLDDLLFFGNTMEEILVVRGSVIILLQHLGFVINFKKRVLEQLRK